METCTHAGCNKPVLKAGYKFCLEHWKSNHTSKPSAVELDPALTNTNDFNAHFAQKVAEKMVKNEARVQSRAATERNGSSYVP